MSARRKKPTFKDFYGEVDTESQDGASSRDTTSGHNQAARNQADNPDGASSTDMTSRFSQASGLAESLGYKLSIKDQGANELINMERMGGPESRVYRRTRREAERMSSESCPDGDKVKRTEKDVMSEPCNICHLCKKTSSEPLKRCSRCLAVSYCSKECQRQDFRGHKMFCWRCDRYDIARARVYPAVRFFLGLRHARDYSVLLKDMPTEQQYQRGATCNLLVEIMEQIPHLMERYMCLVSDISGTMTRLINHDQTNNYRHPSCDSGTRSKLQPLQTCAKPGDFLLLVGTHWRLFGDGRLGIRVNDLDSVYVINMADHPRPKDYKHRVEQAVQQDASCLPFHVNFSLPKQ